MRKIKFRGRNVETGEYVYGDYCAALSCKNPHIRAWKECAYIEVEPDSVAQLVGVDKDGNEVYEGDTVTFPFVDSGKGIVSKLYGFDIIDGDFYHGAGEQMLDAMEVIKNA